ncbi:HAD family hydrolase [Pseudoalteromonas sp. BMB]|nr:HAD family hydrolase [Pseudoalteromonas sp. BMB]
MELQRMYKLAIFDLDGTLIDTLSSITTSVNILRGKDGLDAVEQDVVLPFIGKGSANMLQALCGASTGSLHETVAAYNKVYDDNLFTQLTVYPGIVQLLESLHAQGVKTAVVTNKYHRQALDVLEYCFKHFAFDAIQGVADEALKKPNPTQTLRLIEKLSVQPNEVVFIGDSEVDQRTAQASNIDFRFVTWGYGVAEQLKLKADEIVSSATELQKSILGSV